MSAIEHRPIKYQMPPNLGWLTTELSKDEMNYLWKLIKNKKQNTNADLAGVIHESCDLIDKNNWFFDNVLNHLCQTYKNIFGEWHDAPMKADYNYCLETMWVNYQKQTEFNPLHQHSGIYSFVIWMKIPTRQEDQNKINKGNYKCISSFEFAYTNILGEINPYRYPMNPEVEGTILFFPSKLHHCVYPFYNCDETRISVAGNIYLDFVKNKKSGVKKV